MKIRCQVEYMRLTKNEKEATSFGCEVDKFTDALTEANERIQVVLPKKRKIITILFTIMEDDDEK